MGWRTITRCVRGTRHCRQELPCQDYGAEQVKGSVVIGAIADGAGSAAHSEQGATLAVKTMLAYLSDIQPSVQPSVQRSEHHAAIDPTTLNECFVKGIEQVQNALYTQAEREQYRVESLACTLLGFVATPNWIGAFQVGDGFIVTRSPHQPYRLLFQPDKGEYANQTTFVTSKEAIATLQTQVLTEPQQFICAATDGLESVAIRHQNTTPFAPFFQPLNDYLAETPTPQTDDEYLMAFLQSDRLNQRTDDDKTLLLCRYHDHS